MRSFLTIGMTLQPFLMLRKDFLENLMNILNLFLFNYLVSWIELTLDCCYLCTYCVFCSLFVEQAFSGNNA